MKIGEIEAKLTSEDPELLELARAFITELLAAETARGSAAEGRAATTLGVVSVVAGLAVTAAASVVGGTGPIPWLPLIGYTGALGFLLRGAYYCIRTVSPQKHYVVTPDVIFELQDGSRIDGLRSEIAHKMWQYERDILPNSAKLFWLGRGQRSLFVGVACLLIAVFLTWIDTAHPLCLPAWGTVLTGTVLATAFLIIDPIVERAGGWRRGHHYTMNS